MSTINTPSSTLDYSLSQGVKKLPDFLKVICILTFIGCGLGLISSIYNFVTAESKLAEMQQNIEKITESGGNQKMISLLEDAQSMLEKSVANKYPVFIISMIGIVLCLVGAIMMWKLKKNGFFLYATGELLPPLTLFFILGMGNSIMTISISIFGVILALAFVFMYALNLKHMD